MPICFVIMPFGKKPNSDGSIVDFDRVYSDLIAPAIKSAGLEALRADQEASSGIIHKPMFERLMLCPYSIVDLTQLNPNVFYELGVRHAALEKSTVQIVADGTRLPFDIQMLRTIHYKLGPDGVPNIESLGGSSSAIVKFLEEARDGAKDSPIYQLLNYVTPPDVDHQKADTFREQVEYSKKIQEQLAAARATSLEAVRAIERGLGDNLEDQEAGVLVDLMLSYRDKKGFEEMIALFKRLPRHIASTVMVREQYALALNRCRQRDKAVRVVEALIVERGKSSETLGILGRIHKDAWEDAKDAGETIEARGHLELATKAYLEGFESDWRDSYPGVNAATLTFLSEPPGDRLLKLIPVVRYAVERKIARGIPDYWDYATLVELAALEGNRDNAEHSLGLALAKRPGVFERDTTSRNLRLIRQTREGRGERLGWDIEMETALLGKRP